MTISHFGPLPRVFSFHASTIRCHGRSAVADRHRLLERPYPEDYEYDPANGRLIVASDPPVFVAINDYGTLGAVTHAVSVDNPFGSRR